MGQNLEELNSRERAHVTVCISVKVSEGLVLAADSTATIQGTISNEKGEVAKGILKTYDSARKLSHLKDYPIGTLTWGTYLVGPRSVESLIKEYEIKLASLTEEEEKRRGLRLQGQEPETFDYSVKDIAEGLHAHISAAYESEYGELPEAERPFLGVLVSGYSSGEFFPEQWQLTLPGPDEPQELRPDENGKPSFGANWFGMTDAIVRYHWGRDDRAIDVLAQRFEVPREEIFAILAPLQYPVSFEGMPLQDAIDYAEFHVQLTIDRFRFVVGPPLCGGAIDVAVITPNAFTWVNRKTWKP